MEKPFKHAKYYLAENKRVGIVLFHAYTGSPNDHNLLARRLNREGYNVLVPRFKGHGTMEVFDIFKANTNDWLLDAREAIEWMLNQKFDFVFTFGLSLGGIFATKIMTEYGNKLTAGGVFNSPLVTSQPLDVEMFFMQYARYIYQQNNELNQYTMDEDKIKEAYQKQMYGINEFKQDLSNKLTKITLPFYIAQSGQDEMIFPSDAYHLLSAMTNTEVVFNWFPNNTHVITVNREREHFERSLIEFIERYI